MFKDLLQCNIKGIYVPMRWIVCLIMCGTVAICDIERHVLSLVIATIFSNSTVHTTLCPVNEGDRLIPPQINMTLDFTYSFALEKSMEGAFFISYILFHIPCGIVIDRIGPRAVVGFGVAISTVALIFTPMYYWSTPISLVVSAIMGAAQASLFPGINALCATWAPYFQRGVILGLVFSTYGFIRTINFMITSKILENTYNWYASFYIWGLIGLTWYVIFLMYLYSDPQQHPHMTRLEKEYMKMKAVQRKWNLKIPWKAIIMDKAIWAIISAEIAFSICKYTWNFGAKKYFWVSFAYSIEYSSIFYVLPHMCVILFTLGTGIINDYLIRSGKLSVKAVRRIFSAIGTFLPAVLMVTSGQAGCNKHLALWLFFITLVSQCTVFGAGHLQNILDISVNYPGVVMGIVNAFGASSALAISHLFYFLEKIQMKEQWKLAYYFASSIAALLTIFFIINVSGERADWDLAPEESETWPNRLLEMRFGKREAMQKQISEDDDDLSD